MPIYDTIKRNNLHLFSRPPIKGKSTKQHQISSLKNNCSLFSRLYIAAQVRDGDLDQFFQHENQPCPPSLSQMGSLRGGTKSDLLICLQDQAGENVPSRPTGLDKLHAPYLMVQQLSTCCHLVLPKPSKTMQPTFFYLISHHSFNMHPD